MSGIGYALLVVAAAMLGYAVALLVKSVRLHRAAKRLKGWAAVDELGRGGDISMKACVIALLAAAVCQAAGLFFEVSS